jgi:hypothetical protein
LTTILAGPFRLAELGTGAAERDRVAVRLVVFRKGGEPGEVAINPDHVSHVRTASGPFTDIYIGDQRIAVEGSFAQVLAKLAGAAEPAVEPPPQVKSWLATSR